MAAEFPTVSKRLLDLSIRHKVELSSYEAWVVRRVIALLDAGDADLERRLSIALERTAPLDTLERLAAIRKELIAVNAQAYRRMGYFLSKEMKELAAEESEHLAEAVEGALPFRAGSSPRRAPTGCTPTSRTSPATGRRPCCTRSSSRSSRASPGARC